MDSRKKWRKAVNAFETWCWKETLKIKWTDRIKNDEVFQRAKEDRLLLKIFKNRCHSWISRTIRHNHFVVNVLEGAIPGKKAVGRAWLQYLKQVSRKTGADSYTAMKIMTCNNSRWKAANQSKDWRIRRKYGFWEFECFSIVDAKLNGAHYSTFYWKQENDNTWRYLHV